MTTSLSLTKNPRSMPEGRRTLRTTPPETPPTTRRTMRRGLPLALVALIAMLTLGLSSAAEAHTTEQPYLYLFVTDSGIDGRAELAISDVQTVLGLDMSGDDAAIEAVLRDNAAVLHAYLADHLEISADGQPRSIEFGAVDLFREGSADLVFAVVKYTAGDHSETPKALDVRFDPFFDEIDGRDGLLLINGGFELGEFAPNKETLVTVEADNRSATIDLGADGRWGNFRSSISLGVNHIETGPDHILFVLALLIPSVLVFTDRWEPVAGFGAGLWRVLKIATFFTIAHSITFTLAGMGWLPTPPSKIVETIIAASIAAAALHNLRPIFPNREWSLSFAFGLFHGMGFASLVSSLDVSRSSQLVSLLGRNVGIEIGQVVVILLLFPGLFLLRRTLAYRPFLVISSIVLSALAVFWMIERVFEIDLGTNAIVDSVASVPAGYWVALGFTAVALLVYWRARGAQQLLETEPLRESVAMAA